MKQFIKITSENKPKNKAQELVQEHLKKLDQTLHPGIHDARLAVQNTFYEALQAYKGRASFPVLEKYVPEQDTISYCVDGLVYLDIYTVIKEF